MWQGESPGEYDEFMDRELAERQRETYATDRLCKAV
jgi:hypothetical protein